MFNTSSVSLLCVTDDLSFFGRGQDSFVCFRALFASDEEEAALARLLLVLAARELNSFTPEGWMR